MVNPINVSEKSALERAVKNPPLLPLLVQKVSGRGLQWFDAFENAGLLKPEKNPQPIQTEEGYFRVPSWIIAEYLVSSSELLKEEQYGDYAARYIQLIRDTTQYAIQHEFGNYRTWWQFSKILCNVPPKLIDIEDIELVEYWLSDKFESGILLEELAIWILKLSEDTSEHAKQLVTALLDKIYICSYKPKKFGSKGSIEAEFTYRSYSFRQFIEKTSFKVGQIVGLNAVTILQQCLEEILKRQNDDMYSTIWRPAVEEHSQNISREDANGLVLTAFRDALMGFCLTSSEAAEIYIKQLLAGDYQVTKRVAIFVLGECFDAWEEQTNSILLNPDFFTCHYQHELWHFLAKNFNKFTPEQKQNVFNIIEVINITEEDSDKCDEGATAFRQMIWLTAIKDHDVQALSLYKRAFAITNQEPVHPDFSSYMSSGWVEHKSEMSALEMISIPTNELVNVLNSYETPIRRFDGPDLEGLAKEFRAYVKANPAKVIDEIEFLKNLKLIFIYELIEAYSELWRKKEEQQLDWDKVWQNLICFCSDLVSRNEFWSQENSKEQSAFVANRHWVIGSIGSFVELGCQSDDHAFNISLIEPVKDLMWKILCKQEGNEFKEDSDAVSVAINSPRGKCIQALINLALYMCRQAQKTGESHEVAWWCFEPIFDQELLKAEKGEYEFATLATNYLGNFLYLSNNWVMTNLPNLFYPKNRRGWLCAMQGYSYVNKLQTAVYAYLKKQGLLIKALDEEILSDRTKERFIQLIAVSYLLGIESLEQDNCLIKIVIDRQRPDELRHLIGFIWSQRERDGNNDELAQKVFALWPLLLALVDTDNLEGKKLASQLCHWAVFVTRLESEPLAWLTKIASFAEVEYNAYDLLINLARLSKSYPLEAAKVWLAMLELPSYDYPEESIREILRNVESQESGKFLANNIVDKYLENGYQRPMDWLRDIRKK
ncbi:hypothetical protein [Candidatus Methylobacter oryzae]|uniref:DUF4020 domain-containing protein n=1 Tax=Candidatus Methylobacter oryzae TaxID=2497749 RepID=A0ABY3CC56_9GAMM|nr:hypothetical protein [Candidatus Methylobacter oryzae]TRW97202.1 hypothetical protein EKO24_007695 [Candidatus Methylobacter oryzae]